METVLIIGGSSGIGLGIASRFYKDGYRVLIGSRSLTNLESAQREIGQDLVCHQVDMMNMSSVKALFSEISTIDHLIISASDATLGGFTQLSETDARDFFESKFWAPLRMVKEGIPKIKPTGSITFFSGAAGQRAASGFSVGSVINSAVEALSKNLALELAPIRVNCISPGLIETPVWDQLLSPESKVEFFDHQKEKLPTKRLGTPSDIASAAKFLIENNYVTGTTLFVDGGYLLVN